MDINEIVRLWHKTQIGHLNKCRENQLIFSETMWNLYTKLDEKNEK